MGLKSDFYELAGKVDTKRDEITKIIAQLETMKSELLTIRENIKKKADSIKE